jgi:hypothetical protein
MAACEGNFPDTKQVILQIKFRVNDQVSLTQSDQVSLTPESQMPLYAAPRRLDGATRGCNTVTMSGGTCAMTY